MATYTQLRDGSWGIRADGKPSEGTVVTVRKKSGETKSEMIGRVLWTGKDSKTGQMISLCTIADTGPARYNAGTSAPRKASTFRGRGRRTGCSCGSIEDEPRDSDCASCRHDY